MKSRVALALLLLLSLLPPRSNAGAVCEGMPALIPFASSYHKITVSSAAIGFTAAKYTDSTTGQVADLCIARIESNNIRYNTEGSTPTATEGILAEVSAGSNTFVPVCGRNAVAAFRMIRVTSDATAYVECFRAR